MLGSIKRLVEGYTLFDESGREKAPSNGTRYWHGKSAPAYRLPEVFDSEAVAAEDTHADEQWHHIPT